MVDHQSVSQGEREGGKSGILVGQDNNTNRGEEGRGGGVERESETDGTWYLTLILSGINLFHKRGWK